jgi:RNA polymerase sigma factor (sigma-70 family)
MAKANAYDPAQEESIAKRLSAGDPAALNDLFQMFASDVLLALRKNGIPEVDAEDAIAEALVCIWQHRDRIDPRARLWRYFYAIARNRALDRFRQERRGTVVSLQTDPPAPAPNHDINRPEIARKLIALRRALKSLSSEDRLIVTAHQGGESIASIALELGKNPASLRVRRTRVLQKLRRMIEADESRVESGD